MGIVLNWIVQGVMVTGTAAVALWLLPAGRARARVRVWWTVIATVLSLPLVSMVSAALSAAPAPASGTMPGPADAPLVAVPEAVWPATSLALALWMVWILAQSVRLALDLRALARVRRGCQPVSPSVENRLRPSTRARLAKWRARLMESGDVRAAAVLGFGPPIIAVQPVLLSHLTDVELDQVVVHEWAHVARRDFLGTLVQRLVQVLAGWHPAVWFAIGRLRMEREMACDEVVVDATGSAKAFAACLTRVAALAQASRGSHLAVAMLSSSSLTHRVMRLLARGRTPAFAPYWMIAPAALAVVVAFASGQVSLVGVRIAPQALVEARIVSATPSAFARVADALPPARTPKPALRRTAPRDVPAAAAAMPMPEASVQQAATIPVEQAEEPTVMPLAASSVPPAISQPPAVVPESAVERTTVSGEARLAWTAAAQAGESIGQSSRKGAVAAAGFFTRLSKKVATSFSRSGPTFIEE